MCVFFLLRIRGTANTALSLLALFVLFLVGFHENLPTVHSKRVDAGQHQNVQCAEKPCIQSTFT